MVVACFFLLMIPSFSLKLREKKLFSYGKNVCRTMLVVFVVDVPCCRYRNYCSLIIGIGVWVLGPGMDQSTPEHLFESYSGLRARLFGCKNCLE